jgi:NHL repeat
MNRHDVKVRRSIAAIALTLVAGWLVTPGTAAAAPPFLRTVATGLSAPGGIALDTGGDLFIADTDHCRVVMVAAHSRSLYGKVVRAHHAYVIAGSRCGGRASLGYPTAVAVDGHGDLFIAVATGARVLMVSPTGGRAPITVAGTGRSGISGNGRAANRSDLDQPAGIAVDQRGDLFIADTANCVVREVPASTTIAYGQAMLAHHLYTLVGTGVCGSSGRPGPMALAQLWDPTAVAVDAAGDLAIADGGDQSVVEAAVHAGSFYGTLIGSGDAATVVGSGNGNGPYLNDGLSATGVGAELNDPTAVALGTDNIMFIADGSAHVVRVVPDTTTAALGRPMTAGDLYTLAGALPITTSAGLGNGTKWIRTKIGLPDGLAVTAAGAVDFSDASDGVVRQIEP